MINNRNDKIDISKYAISETGQVIDLPENGDNEIVRRPIGMPENSFAMIDNKYYRKRMLTREEALDLIQYLSGALIIAGC